MVSAPLVQKSGLPPTVQLETLATALVIVHLKVRVRLGFASFVTVSGESSVPFWKLPKLGTFTLSLGLSVTVITAPLTLQVSGGIVVLPVRVQGPSIGAVCDHPVSMVSVNVTVAVPSPLGKVSTAKA